MKARTLLKKLTDHGLIVKIVGDNIRLSPPGLVNDKVLAFVRTHKNDLLCALCDEQNELHVQRKRALREGRLEVFRILLRRFLNDPQCRAMVNYKSSTVINGKAVEDYLDMELINFDYDLEAMIEMYRHYTPKPQLTIQCGECGYNRPFCSCERKSVPGIITCNACEHFTPDQIGDGAGIGQCGLGITWTQELKGHMPLYRYADRHCDKFSKLMS